MRVLRFFILILVLFLSKTVYSQENIESNSISSKAFSDLAYKGANDIGHYIYNERRGNHFYAIFNLSQHQLKEYKDILDKYKRVGFISQDDMLRINRFSNGFYGISILNDVKWKSDKYRDRFKKEIIIAEKWKTAIDFEEKMVILGKQNIDDNKFMKDLVLPNDEITKLRQDMFLQAIEND